MVDMQLKKCGDLDICSIFSRANIDKVEILITARETSYKVFDQDRRADDSGACASFSKSTVKGQRGF